MAARYQAQILAQIRDGKRGKDLEIFHRHVVEPLRELKYAGLIPALSEIEADVAGRERIIGVQLIGVVNIQAREE